MELCATLLEDFKKNTVQELKKKGMTVLDAQGRQVDKVEDILGDWSKVSRKRSPAPEQAYMCKARIWNDAFGARCSKVKTANSDYCTQHNNHIEKYGKLIFGRWRGARELRYPDNFGRRSNSVISWKGTDSDTGSPKLKKVPRPTPPSRNTSSKVRAAVKLQAVQRGRKVRKTQRSRQRKTQKKASSQKKASPGFFEGILGDIVGKARSDGSKRRKAAVKIQAATRGRKTRKARKDISKTRRLSSSPL